MTDPAATALMIGISMRDHGQGKAVGIDIDAVHIRENGLLRRVGEAAVHKNGAFTGEQILEDISARVDRLDLMNARIQFHATWPAIRCVRAGAKY